jgi:uncharacterized membrane protein YeaQ/YmgE (transglycosylase-associated protein family)
MEAAIDITIGKIIIYIVAGLIIGLLARLVVPGRQHMSIVATIILGVIAAVIGGILWNAIFPGNDGIAWIGSIIVAVVLVWLYSRFAGQRTTGAPGARGLPRGGRGRGLRGRPAA